MGRSRREEILHEFSLAQSIVETVLQAASQHGASAVEEVNLEVGEVALVNMEQLEWHIRMLTQATPAQGARIRWRTVPASILCLECGYQGLVGHKELDPSSHFEIPMFQCPACESPNTKILSGRELRVVDIHARFQEHPSGEVQDA